MRHSRTRACWPAMRLAVGVGALLAGGCSGGAVGEPVPLTLQPVEWNPAHAALGRVDAVVEIEEDLVVYGDQGATVLSGAAVAGSDASIKAWRAAATIPAADGTGTWAVGVDSTGRVRRLRARMSLEDVTDRYGLAHDPISSLAAMGGKMVAFGLAAQVAVADGMAVTRFDEGALSGLAGGGGRVAGITASSDVRVLDAQGRSIAFSVGDAVAVAFAVDGRLVVAARHAIYLGDQSGASLALLFHDPSATLHGIAVSGAWVWIGAGGELIGLSNGKLYRTSGLGIPADATLTGSTSGDAWVLSGGELTRFMAPVSGDAATWRTKVLPVYARVCSACHAPGGTANIPLSTYAQWSDRRAAVYQRVIVKGDMPQGRTLSDGDKAAIAAWASPK